MFFWGGGLSGTIEDLNPGKYYGVGFSGSAGTDSTICATHLPSNFSYWTLNNIGSTPSGKYRISSFFLQFTDNPNIPGRLNYNTSAKYTTGQLRVNSSAGTFVLGAAGILHGNYNVGNLDAKRDAWSMDQDKTLTHEQRGE